MLLDERGVLRVIWALKVSGCSNFRALAAATKMAPGTLNDRIKKLVAAGLLLKEPYRLTPEGREVAKAIGKTLKAVDDAMQPDRRAALSTGVSAAYEAN